MKKLVPMPRLAVALLLAVVAVGCGDDGSGDAAETTSTTVPPPSRIVSLSPSLTELLYAVGAGDQVIAVDRNSDFPAGVPTTDLSGFQPNVEAIADLDPDLVLVSGNRDGIVDALEDLGIDPLLLPTPDEVDSVFLQILRIGEATGHSEEAEELVEEMEADIEELAALVPDRTQPFTYFYELSDDLSTVTPNTFVGSLLESAGLRSIADGSGYLQLSIESIIADDPDYIFVAHSDGESPDAAALAARPGWADLTAVQTPGRVVVLPTDIASRWGPRIVDLLRLVVDATT